MTEAQSPPHIRGGGVLHVENLVRNFRGPRGSTVQAVSGVSFDVQAGETLGLVGESGCGKSTTARTILQAPPPTSGNVWFGGVDVAAVGPEEMRRLRRRMQLVFQDPFSSLNPRWTVEKSLLEPMQVHRVGNRASQEDRVEELLELVGLDPGRYRKVKPGQLSGGQCQRVAIARALVLSPDLILFDEAVSSLDVSIQAQVLNLIGELQRELSLTSVFIAHDLAVVKQVSDRVGVMYLGKLCEIGRSEEIYRHPAHPYTEALLSAVPRPDPLHGSRSERIRLLGDLPSPTDPPSGCRFRTRCPVATSVCSEEEPEMVAFGEDQFAACHHPLRQPVVIDH